ncbi:MAG TPA: cupin domain-containing protein [Pseudolabrys sp.]
MFGRILICAVVAVFAPVNIAAAQQQLPAATQQGATIKRTPLQKFDVPGTNCETVIGMAEIVPNVNVGRHTHPGPESGYMVEGEFVLYVEGQPEKIVKAGQSYQIPPGAIHDAKTGPSGPKVVATYVVEKGKPLASPAP